MPETSHHLSILIPTYNDVCVGLVDSLSTLACQTTGLTYEILVADDGSTSSAVIEANQEINAFPHARYILRKQNVGRSAIRNFLAQQAQYDLLLFIDSHMSVVNDSFLSDYLSYHDSQLVYGGYTVDATQEHKGNLRHAYELSCIAAQDASYRALSPYSNFHTSNFMIHREVMLAYPLDERFRYYGYEDVLFGKQLKSAGINITHINNPVGFARFEDNLRFVEKTEEGLQTLYAFQEELRGYSRLLTISERLRDNHLLRLFHMLHSCLGRPIRSNLIGRHPSLYLFKIYKLTYFSTLPYKRTPTRTHPAKTT